jgi:hypothetical protein
MTILKSVAHNDNLFAHNDSLLEEFAVSQVPKAGPGAPGPERASIIKEQPQILRLRSPLTANYAQDDELEFMAS